jgi:hypothetical protein
MFDDLSLHGCCLNFSFLLMSSTLDLTLLQGSSPLAELEQFGHEVVPKHIEELKSSAEKLGQLAAYCRSFYAQPELPRAEYKSALEQTKTFAVQSLSTVAYQLGAAAASVSDYMNVQASAAEEQASELQIMAIVRLRK